MQKMLNIKQASEKMNLKVSTLYMWVHKKKIPYVKIGGKLVFKEQQLEEFINSKNFIPES